MLGVGRSGACGRSEPVAAGVDLEALERDAWVVLDGVQGVGPVSFARLIGAFGDARAVLRVATGRRGPSLLVSASAGPDGGSPSLSIPIARAIVAAAREPDRCLEPLRRSGVRAVTLADGDYPGRLRRIELPPPVLYVAGSSEALDRVHAVAVVGTRRPTAVGRATSGRIADAIAGLGATVVSGLALGIDAAAHAAALRAGGVTVAVIGGGHGRLYPAAHRTLARVIVRDGGAVISEFPPETTPSRGTFPRRNRIISGLADATVVVEAGARSGALTTAAWALEQGRGLHIVPGRLDDPAVAGCLAFLREAGPEARIVPGIAELIEDLGLLTERSPAVPAGRDVGLAALPAAEQTVSAALLAGHGSVDELVAATGLAGAAILGSLTRLELRGLAVETFGRYRPAGPLARPPDGAADHGARAALERARRATGAAGQGS